MAARLAIITTFTFLCTAGHLRHFAAIYYNAAIIFLTQIEIKMRYGRRLHDAPVMPPLGFLSQIADGHKVDIFGILLSLLSSLLPFLYATMTNAALYCSRCVMRSWMMLSHVISKRRR